MKKVVKKKVVKKVAYASAKRGPKPKAKPVVVEKPVSEAIEPVTSVGFLLRATQIQENRAKQYDQPGGERSMGRTVAAFNLITNRTSDRALTESEGWLLLQILKDVRDRTTAEPHRDSLEDKVSYSALGAEARIAGR